MRFASPLAFGAGAGLPGPDLALSRHPSTDPLFAQRERQDGSRAKAQEHCGLDRPCGGRLADHAGADLAEMKMDGFGRLKTLSPVGGDSQDESRAETKQPVGTFIAEAHPRYLAVSNGEPSRALRNLRNYQESSMRQPWTDAGEITTLLSAWSGGNDNARDRLLTILYDELRIRARRLISGERPDHSISATGLVHEVYLRFANQSGPSCTSRAHFLSAASGAMRRILVDQARARKSAKRGGAWQSSPLDPSALEEHAESPGLVEVDDALIALATVDELQARIIELRFFGGLSIAETAHVLELSSSTVKREWQMARAWLSRRLLSRPARAV